MVEPQPSLFAHLFAQTRQNVELLMAYGQISKIDGEEIMSKLSTSAKRHSEESSIVSLTQKTQRLSMSPGSQRAEARAIWGWSGEDPNDLSFEAGEIIEIVRETNADWWTGRNRSGKQGLFPSNHVEKLPPQGVSPKLVPEPRASTMSDPGRYAPPAQAALPYPPPQAPPQAQYLPAGGYYQPPLGPPPGPSATNYPYTAPVDAPTPQPAPQQPAKKSKFGGLGQMMAQSAASGVGFGAGAAIANDLVNAIF